MTWYKVITLVLSINYTIQYPNTYVTYIVKTGSNVQITPTIIAPSNDETIMWHVMVMSLYSMTSYSSWSNVPAYISYNQVNITFTITNVTITSHYQFELNDGQTRRAASVHVIVYGKYLLEMCKQDTYFKCDWVCK